jgi:hypothetical protein
MKFPDRYRYPLFFIGMVLMIASAFAYKFSILTLEIEEVLIVLGAIFFVFSIASSLIN